MIVVNIVTTAQKQMEFSSSEWRMHILSSHHYQPNSVYRYVLLLIYVQEVSDSILGSETIMTEVFCGLPQAIQENSI
jgi:hypothetical protein